MISDEIIRIVKDCGMASVEKVSDPDYCELDPSHQFRIRAPDGLTTTLFVNVLAEETYLSNIIVDRYHLKSAEVSLYFETTSVRTREKFKMVRRCVVDSETGLKDFISSFFKSASATASVLRDISECVSLYSTNLLLLETTSVGTGLSTKFFLMDDKPTKYVFSLSIHNTRGGELIISLKMYDLSERAREMLSAGYSCYEVFQERPGGSFSPVWSRVFTTNNRSSSRLVKDWSKFCASARTKNFQLGNEQCSS